MFELGKKCRILRRCMCSTVPWGGGNSWTVIVWFPARKDPQEPEELRVVVSILEVNDAVPLAINVPLKNGRK